MKRNLVTLIVVLLGNCLQLSAEPAWISLFDGKDLKGWKILNGTAKFIIEDGTITGITQLNTPNTFLATRALYDDFILEYEIKADADLNSGVQIRSLSKADYHDGRVHGYQVEFDPSPRSWSGGIYDEARRGWLYNLEYNSAGKSAFIAGDWNSFRIEAIGPHIRVWLNGVQTADLVDTMTPRGFIALQVHSIGTDSTMAGRKIRFRNLRILTAQPEKYQHQETKDIPQISYLNNQLTPREIEEGWKLLWDGVSTSGWRGARLDHFPEMGWTIQEGILKVDKSGGGESSHGGDIVTVDKFRDFTLEADFRLTEGANSGIKYFVDTDLNQGEGSSIGCEYQLLDDAVHPDAKMGTAGNRTLASLYDLIPADASFYAPNESTSKRVNVYGWNRARIVVRGSHVSHYLNGIQVVHYERGNQTWRALVARSKYVVWPEFGELSTGHILLQDHGDEVHFKNIKIKIEDPS